MSGSQRFTSLAPDSPAIDRLAEFKTLSDEQFVRRFLEPAMWRVLDFPKTAWWGHLQFMFSVVDLVRPRRFVELGSHHGTSFFAANQAAQRLNLEMEAMAVDSWEGEQHTGEYDDSVYQGFVQVLERRQYKNAVPLKMYFDDAASLFEPASIDLLHIDGLHTFEAVSHDYETWIDKVVPGGLVLFHDVNVHQKDFGVWRLWRQLVDDAPDERSFTFNHSHGLGVLQKEGAGFPQLSRLLSILHTDPDLSSFTQLLIASVSELAHLASQLEPTQTAASIHRDARNELRESLARTQAELKALATERDGAQREVVVAAERQRSQRERLAESVEALRELRIELTTAQSEASAQGSRAKAAKAEVSRSREATNSLRNRNQKLKADAARAELRTQLSTARSRAAQTRSRLHLERSLQTIDAEVVTPTPESKLRRVMRAAKGDPASPAASLDTKAIAERVREQILVSELGESGLFDEAYYLATYPDVTDGPLLHFVRHGRFEDRKPNEFFDPSVYRKRNPDVAARGIEATEHYLHFGSYELRSIGDSFDSPGYLMAYRDVAKAGANALGHYLRSGRENGRSPRPTNTADGNTSRRRKTVDRVTDRKTTNALLTSYKDQRDTIDNVLVSIVMPSYNRASLLPRAIASVQAQTHQEWELIIVDDGSTDDTPEVLDRLSRDPRIQVVWNGHSGVSGARNAGLDAARGEFVAFLDTDNEWTPEYLRLMVTHLTDSGAQSAYSGMVVRDEKGNVTSYLSSDFDWEACYDGNYVDMNVFMHRRDVRGGSGTPFRFETRLKRMVDWDYILRITRDAPASHAPFVGCFYYDSTATDDRISKSEPMIYRELVRKRNDPSVEEPPSFAQLADELVLDFAIRISAPWTKRHTWGDTHYALALQAAIEKLGHTARIVYQDDGDRLSRGPKHEVNLVLRGLTPHGPVADGLNILWVISHPEKVSTAEMAGYNMVYVASESHAALLQHDPKVEPRVLMQATAFQRSSAKHDGGVVFVGNSRNVERPIVEWAASRGLDLRLYGGGWQDSSAAGHCLGTSYPNEQLPELYASADAVLNDHWESMREFGYISNRVFDVLAAGGSVVSDPMPAMDRFFGSAVQQVSSADDLADAVSASSDVTERDQVAEAVRTDHSFDARARQIVNDVFGYLTLDQPFDPTVGSSPPWRPNGSTPEVRYPAAPSRETAPSATSPLAVGALFMGNRVGYQSSAYIRVLSPLTTEEHFSHLQVVANNDPRRLDVDSLDAVIVGRTALADLAAANHLVNVAQDAGTALVVDVDDSFGSLEPGSTEYELYQPRLAALRYVIEHASAVTVSTPGIAEAFGLADDPRAQVVKNTLDPRWWRRYPRPDQVEARDPEARLRLLYMGTATHDDDFELVLEALDAWSEVEDFELTIIGAVRNPPSRPWIRTTAVPRGLGLYPRFAHWLTDQPQFDIGLAPLQDTEFNAGKSDIKFLDYCAIGAVPVLSDVDAYRRDSQDKGLAYHASNDSESWVAALSDAAAEVRQGARTDERRAWLWECRTASHAGKQLIDIIHQTRARDETSVARDD